MCICQKGLSNITFLYIICLPMFAKVTVLKRLNTKKAYIAQGNDNPLRQHKRFLVFIASGEPVHPHILAKAFAVHIHKCLDIVMFRI